MSSLLERFQTQPIPAIRLSISRLKTGWAVTDEYKIDKMIIPAHHEFPILSGNQVLAGSWFEVRDHENRLIYTRRFNLPNLMETHNEKGQTVRGTVVDELVDPIQIIIPDIDQTNSILLFTTTDPRRGKQIRPNTTKKPIPFAVFNRTEAN